MRRSEWNPRAKAREATGQSKERPVGEDLDPLGQAGRCSPS
jgi:hypothetical protein